MNPAGPLRQLVGKLLGREGNDRSDPFSDNPVHIISSDATLLSDDDYAELESRLGYRINDRRIFVEALTHRSYLQVVDDETIDSNERLEFLGDSILNMLIGEFLFRHYTEVQEGELTKLRSRLVNKAALILGAHAVGLEQFVLLNSSATQSLKQGNHSILADAFEAIIAAIYLDSGLQLQPVKQFLTRTILKPATFQEILQTDENFKSALLEHAQGTGFEAPRYVVIREEGPDHERSFTVEVYINGSSWGEGTGKSKKKAEQEAARVGLARFMEKYGEENVDEDGGQQNGVVDQTISTPGEEHTEAE